VGEKNWGGGQKGPPPSCPGVVIEV